MSKKNIFIASGALLLVVGGLLYAYEKQAEISDMSNGSDDTATMPMPEPTPPVATPPVTSDQSGTEKVFTITGANFSFTPNVITVNKGDKVKIKFVNSSGFHDFKIDELGVQTNRISGGQTATVEFVASKTGSFEYYCSVGEHRAMGMWGTLIVQ